MLVKILLLRKALFKASRISLVFLTFILFSFPPGILSTLSVFQPKPSLAVGDNLNPEPAKTNLILIKQAYLLDENQNFINDITDQVKEKDDQWETIKDGQYIKVVFEKPLDSMKEITIFSRAENSEAFIEISTGTNPIRISEFPRITEEKSYQALLHRLRGQTDTFWLKIRGDIQLDQIKDPYVWTEQSSVSGKFSWWGITSSSDGTKLAASVYDGYIFTSEDSGTTWVRREAAGSRYWWNIASSADGSILAAGDSGGYIYTSDDYGETWTQQTGSGEASWVGVAISSDGTKLAAAAEGSDGYIYTSDNSGVTWTALESSAVGSRYWWDVTISDDGTKLAAIDPYGEDWSDGYIYTSVNSGSSWTQQTGAGKRDWWSVDSSADGSKLVASEYNGYIYTSDDSGATWTQRTGTLVRNCFFE